MVEEKFRFRRTEIFEFRLSEIHQNEGFKNVHHRISSPWLKKFLNSDDLEYTRIFF